jgi:hypothetical protein
MIKPDEIALINLVLACDGLPSVLWDYLGKREYYILDKWADKGYWDYGSSLRAGWLTDEGKKKFWDILLQIRGGHDDPG